MCEPPWSSVPVASGERRGPAPSLASSSNSLNLPLAFNGERLFRLRLDDPDLEEYPSDERRLLRFDLMLDRPLFTGLGTGT